MSKRTVPMTGVTFSAWRGDTYIPLTEVMKALGIPASHLKWQLNIDEVAIEPGADAVYAVPPGELIEASRLIELFTPALQVIDGTFTGIDELGAPQVVTRAVDGGDWDVEATSPSVIDRIIAAFPDAQPLPPSEHRA